MTLEEVFELHADQLRLFGDAAGVRDRGAALEAAVSMPAATFDGAFLHTSVFEMAAAYAFHIAQNQPLVHGNKRTGLNAALVFLYVNGWSIADPQMELYDAMLAFAIHTLDKMGFARLLESLAIPLGDDD